MFFSTNIDSEDTDLLHPVRGNHSFVTYLHEIGHALGLGHAGNYNGGSPTYANDALFAQDTERSTVMSYFQAVDIGDDIFTPEGDRVFAQTLMLYDIAAIQTLYGVNTSTRSGDTVYGFQSTLAETDPFNFEDNRYPVICIWDSGGTDTLNFSRFQASNIIDLRAGSYSSSDHLTNNISIAFGAVIERAIGGSGNDRITGNGASNWLDGCLESDIILGGAGNDTYVVDSSGDRVFETTTTGSGIDSGGIDTVRSEVTFNLDAYAAVRFVERLVLSGLNINGTGNALANLMTGSAGNNVLNGRLGNDTMIGRAGNDTYYVDAAGDRVFETTTTASQADAGGIDTVRSSVTFNLDAYTGVRFVERLTLIGADVNATGNDLANLITGSDGRNKINGGLGNDTLAGGAGRDTFVFNAALGSGNIDRITDFSAVDDTIRLEDSTFFNTSAGVLDGIEFAANTSGQAVRTSDRIIYETDTGRVYFDSDGVGGMTRIHFATLTANLALTNVDFSMI